MRISAALIPQIWSARITHFLTRFSTFLPQVNRAYEGDAVMGNTVKVPTIDRSVTIQDYDATADLAVPEAITGTTQDVAIDQEKYFSFALEDIGARQSVVGGAQLIDIKSQGAGIGLAETVDEYIASLHNAIAANDLAYNEAAAAFNLDFVSEVKTQATLINQPLSQLVAITAPEVIEKIDKGVIAKTYGDVVTAANFSSGSAGDPVSQGMGFAMQVGGLRIFASNSRYLRQTNTGQTLAANAANRGTKSVMHIFNPMDIALIQQVNSVEIYRLEKRFATGVKGLLNFGGKVLNAGRMMKLVFND